MVIESPNGMLFQGEPEDLAALAIIWYGKPRIEYPVKGVHEELPWPFNMELPSMRLGGTSGG